MFFEYKSHEDALEAVANIPPPVVEDDASVLHWDLSLIHI